MSLPVLYHCLAARSFRVLWTLEELQLRYDLKVLPFPPRLFQREYLQVNALGTIPAFFDGEVGMTESAAICQYLATRHGPSTLAVAVHEPDYGAWLNALHFGEATLTFPQTLVLRYTRLEPPARRNPQAALDYQKWFLGRMRAVEPWFARDYLCAGRFTVADVSVAYALLLAEHLGLREELPVAACSYLDRLKERAGFQRALAAELAGAAAAGIDTDVTAAFRPRD